MRRSNGLTPPCQAASPIFASSPVAFRPTRITRWAFRRPRTSLEREQEFKGARPGVAARLSSRIIRRVQAEGPGDEHLSLPSRWPGGGLCQHNPAPTIDLRCRETWARPARGAQLGNEPARVSVEVPSPFEATGPARSDTDVMPIGRRMAHGSTSRYGEVFPLRFPVPPVRRLAAAEARRET